MTLRELNTYIDVCLIDEYADKDFENGYSLDIDSVPDNERSNFLDFLMEQDTAVRDFVLTKMQDMINARLPYCEEQDRFHRGRRIVRLSNGDQFITGDAV